MDRGKWYKACTHDKEVKQLLKPVNPQTELYEKTRSPKDCTDHGMYTCLPQIITCKMMIRSEVMCNVTALRLQIPEKTACVILTSLHVSEQEIHSCRRCRFVLSRCYLKSPIFYIFF